MTPAVRKGIILLIVCTLAGYIGGKYPIIAPALPRCQEMVYQDLLEHHQYEGKLQKAISPTLHDVLTEASRPK